MPTVRTRWAPGDVDLERLEQPRDDVVAEVAVAPGEFDQRHGPFTAYRRRVHSDEHGTTQTVEYHLHIPWFRWLFAAPARRTLRRMPAPGRQPWWAPPERLDARGVMVLGLLSAASLIVGYCNTLFTQTVSFAADEYGVGEGAQGVAGTVVRFGILLSIVVMSLSDRVGRRRVLVGCAALSPALCALGALAPSFAVLTVTQTVGRPLAIALGLLVSIVAAEEMPAGSRAYAISLLGMASGLGAGLCVMALPLADLGVQAWRFVYVLPLVFLVIAFQLARSLPESRRFAQPHARHATMAGGRFALLAVSGFLLNLLIAPSSFFQNRYLQDVRGFSASDITVYTLLTGTPAGIGIVAGGRLADVHGRRRVGAFSLVGMAVMVVITFSVGGVPLWLASVVGSVVGALAVPALGVYWSELFPTNRRGRANGLMSAVSIAGSSVGLLIVGGWVDAGGSYGTVMAMLALGPLAYAVLVMTRYPETARVALDDLNPEDRSPA
jgi:predicted MFS family arabinose efflux permease